jgi:pantoate--beta-alanine ligase
MMKTCTTLDEFKALRQQWHPQTVALVPTMGALHEGHQALIARARSLADIVVVSIFVNPIQFLPQEDFTRYPRPLEADLACCEALGVDGVFLPSVEEMYPAGQADFCQVVPPAVLTHQLCGLSRPGHFEGVATVVLKLFNIIQPTFAVFGEKDAQQLAVIQKMVSDLNVPVTIVPHPTVRETSGLAVSSRNQYLASPEERQAAQLLSSVLQEVKTALTAQGANAPRSLKKLLAEAYTAICAQNPQLSQKLTLEYLEVVDRQTLLPTETLCEELKVLIAARVGAVRLIDNMDITLVAQSAKPFEQPV